MRSYQINTAEDNDNISLHIEIGDIVNASEMNIVYHQSEIFAYLPSFIEVRKCAKIRTNSGKGKVQAKGINAAYDEIINWEKKLFKVPLGKSGKNFFLELAKWLEHCNTKSNNQNIALKVLMILLALFKNLRKLVRLKIIVTN